MWRAPGSSYRVIPLKPERRRLIVWEARHDNGWMTIFGLPDGDRHGFVTRRGLKIVSDIHMSDLRARYLPPAEARAVPELAKAGSYICTAAVP